MSGQLISMIKGMIFLSTDIKDKENNSVLHRYQWEIIVSLFTDISELLFPCPPISVSGNYFLVHRYQWMIITSLSIDINEWGKIVLVLNCFYDLKLNSFSKIKWTMFTLTITQSLYLGRRWRLDWLLTFFVVVLFLV